MVTTRWNLFHSSRQPWWTECYGTSRIWRKNVLCISLWEEPFMKPPIGNECEVFMEVSVWMWKVEPFARQMPVLSCQCVGIPSPSEKKKKYRSGIRNFPVGSSYNTTSGECLYLLVVLRWFLLPKWPKAGMGLLSKIKGSKMMRSDLWRDTWSCRESNA